MDGAGKRLIPGTIYAAGQSIPTYTAPKLLLTLGNASVRMRVNGRLVRVPASRQRDPLPRRSHERAADPTLGHSDLPMSARAGILITGTEVLTGIISDRNGPWLSERLREIGVDAAQIQIVGDRPDDLLAALEFMAREGLSLIVTSGGLGPTADDLTAEVVGRFTGRPMVLDAELEERIAEILRPMMQRWPGLDLDAIRASNRKQAVIPEGATILDPVGTAPGLVVPRRPRAPVRPWWCCPGPPRELQPMWETARSTEAFRAATAGATTYRRGIVRLFGIPESEIANTLRAAEAAGLQLDTLEITTCLRRGEIEIATRYEPPAQDGLRRADRRSSPSATPTRCSPRTGRRSTTRSRRCCEDRSIAVAESCTGGLMAARLTDRAGSSAYFAGGVVAYSNEAKIGLVGVDPDADRRLRRRVDRGRARRWPIGAIERFAAGVGVGITGIAGPDGGTEEKPVGLVCFSVATARRRPDHAQHPSPGRARRRPGSLAPRSSLPGAPALRGDHPSSTAARPRGRPRRRSLRGSESSTADDAARP